MPQRTTNSVQTDAYPTRGGWTPQQLKLAFHLYCLTPFGKLHQRNPDIIQLAGQIGRTPGALAMKLSNFASLDPSIIGTGRRGLSGASVQDREIWAAFHADWERLAEECEQLQAQLRHGQHAVRELPPDGPDDGIGLDDYSDETRQAIVQQRKKQTFFRRAVLASYRDRCCISGVSDTRLLIASHIVPWSEDKANRLNPRNGLCLSAIHDKAFDKHLFSLTDELRIVLSRSLKNSKDAFVHEVFWSVEDKPIELPERFAPDRVFIAKHREITLADAGSH